MRRKAIIAALACSIFANAFLAPLLINSHLRFVYSQTIERWRAKILRPDAVILGDSVAASLREAGFQHAINLSSNGYTSCQAAETARVAHELNPRRIFVFVGVNDYFFDASEKQAKECLSRVAALPNVAFILPLPTRSPEANERLQSIRSDIRLVAERHHSQVLDLSPAVTDADGLLDRRLTSDGTHLSARGLEIVKRELQRHVR